MISSGTGPATAAVGDAVGSEDWAQQQAAAGRCHIILTSSYGYRQFIPLDAALAPAGDDPLGDVLLPTAAATPATPAALPRRSEPAATAGPTARPGDRIVLRFQVRRGCRAVEPAARRGSLFSRSC